MKAPALIVIDMLNDFLQTWPAASKQRLISSINSLARSMRQRQLPARLKPDGLIIAGINTHACIRATAIDAYQRDWDVIAAADRVDSYDREHHDISLRYLNGKIATTMGNREIVELLMSA